MVNRSENPEFKLQSAAVKLFRLKYPQYIIFSTNNEACYKSKQYFTSLGLLKGVSDTIIITPKKTIFVEFKAGHNRQSVEQIEFMNKVESMGYDYHLVYDIDTFIEIINELN